MGKPTVTTTCLGFGEGPAFIDHVLGFKIQSAATSKLRAQGLMVMASRRKVPCFIVHGNGNCPVKSTFPQIQQPIHPVH